MKQFITYGLLVDKGSFCFKNSVYFAYFLIHRLHIECSALLLLFLCDTSVSIVEQIIYMIVKKSLYYTVGFCLHLFDTTITTAKPYHIKLGPLQESFETIKASINLCPLCKFVVQ